eukprot:Nk52_evm4s273 gene=Nk52_evmTU4s273
MSSLKKYLSFSSSGKKKKGTFVDSLKFQKKHQPCSENAHYPDRNSNNLNYFEHSSHSKRYNFICKGISHSPPPSQQQILLSRRRSLNKRGSVHTSGNSNNGAQALNQSQQSIAFSGQNELERERSSESNGNESGRECDSVTSYRKRSSTPCASNGCVSLKFKGSRGFTRCIQSYSRVRPTKSSNCAYFEVEIKSASKIPSSDSCSVRSGGRSARSQQMKENGFTTRIAIGMGTKPYPPFRLPGVDLYSIGFHSHNGHVYNDDPFGGFEYDAPFGVGDVIGCGYVEKLMNGRMYQNYFFTKNGEFLGIAATLTELYGGSFACIGADGDCELEVNFGGLENDSAVKPFRFDIGSMNLTHLASMHFGASASLNPRLFSFLSRNQQPIWTIDTPELKRRVSMPVSRSSRSANSYDECTNNAQGGQDDEEERPWLSLMTSNIVGMANEPDLLPPVYDENAESGLAYSVPPTDSNCPPGYSRFNVVT